MKAITRLVLLWCSLAMMALPTAGRTPCTLTSVNIPSSVTNIERWAFAHCTSLTSVNIPSNGTSVAEGAFYGCTSLTSVNIPSGVTNIERWAFAECTSLTSVNSLSPLGQRLEDGGDDGEQGKDGEYGEQVHHGLPQFTANTLTLVTPRNNNMSQGRFKDVSKA